jgi:hypothetical protein
LKFDPLKLDVACGAENKGIFIKAAPGFEPGMEVLQTSALPLGYAAASTANYHTIILYRIAHLNGRQIFQQPFSCSDIEMTVLNSTYHIPQQQYFHVLIDCYLKYQKKTFLP